MRFSECHTLTISQLDRKCQALGVEVFRARDVAGMVERLTQIAQRQGGPGHMVELAPEGKTLFVKANRPQMISLEECQRSQTRQTCGDVPDVIELSRVDQRILVVRRGLRELFLRQVGVTKVAQG